MGKFIGDGSGLTNLPSSIPSGGIILWSGSTSAVPSGWALCDGLNGTPDLRGRFVVGSGEGYTQGEIGGSADAVVVSHNHSASTSSDGYHGHSASTSTTGSHRHHSGRGEADDFSTWYGSYVGSTRHRRQGLISGDSNYYAYTSTNGNHSHTVSVNGNGSHTHSVSVNSTGDSGVGKNLPPYYALAYIMKT